MEPLKEASVNKTMNNWAREKILRKCLDLMKLKEKYKTNLAELEGVILGLQQDLSTASHQSYATTKNYMEELACKDTWILAIRLQHSGGMQKKESELRRVTSILRSEQKTNNE